MTCFYVLAGLALPTVQADQSPTIDDAPLLRVECGMHTSQVTAMATDRKQDFLVTASTDKTLRIWRMADRSLYRIVRPAISEGYEGQLYSTAISPDGSTVACAGVTGAHWSRSRAPYCIYIFDVSTGAEITRITNLEFPAVNLRYLTGGDRLIASLAGGGVRVFDLHLASYEKKYVEFARDTYGPQCVALDTSTDDQVATACVDGKLRLYSAPDLKARKMVSLPPGIPTAVRFSPTFDKLAVAFQFCQRVLVYRTSDLKLIKAIDLQSAITGNLTNVCWGRDNTTLYASEQLDGDHGWRHIVKLSAFDATAPTVLDASQTSITSMISLADGNILFASQEPRISELSADTGRVTVIRDSATLAFHGRSDSTNLFVSDDASVVEVGSPADTSRQMWFSTLSAQLLRTVSDRTQVRMNPPAPVDDEVTNDGAPGHFKLGSKSIDFTNGSTPSVNETLVSACKSANGSFFVGTNFGIRWYRPDGAQVASVKLPDKAYAVNATPNGRILVAAVGDGTVRWFALRDNRINLLCSLYVQSDLIHWISWTPSGYYACSLGGEDLVGWHVNRNANLQPAAFYPASQFKDRFYRPDILKRLLQSNVLDEQSAVNLANAARQFGSAPSVNILDDLPPTVQITNTAARTGVNGATATLNYHYSADRPIKELHVLADGSLIDTIPISTSKDVTFQRVDGVADKDSFGSKPSHETKGAISISLPSPTSKISIVAYDANGRASLPTSRMIRLVDAAKPGSLATSALPRLFIIAVGVSNYQMPALQLNYPSKDADAFVNVMKSQSGIAYASVDYTKITDSNATRANILDAFEALKGKPTNTDVTMIFLSGHGTTDSEGEYYFVPYDYDENHPSSTAVPDSEIRRKVGKLRGRRILFIDSCQAGNVVNAGSFDSGAFGNSIATAESGTELLLASDGFTSALEDPAWGNGAFTKVLVEGLTGLADTDHEGGVDFAHLTAYVQSNVKKLTHGQQWPVNCVPSTMRDYLLTVNKATADGTTNVAELGFKLPTAH